MKNRKKAAALRGGTLFVLLLAGAAVGWMPAPGIAARPAARVERYLRSIRRQPPLLTAFFRRMPKGGDLHNHLSGAIYAETYIRWAAAAGDCARQPDEVVIPPPCGPHAPAIQAALHDSAFYTRLLDAWSMLGWRPALESGHDHFFATFDKYSLAHRGHFGDMLAEAANRAGREHVIYLELMDTLDGSMASHLGMQAGWTPDLAQMQARLARAGIARAVAAAERRLDAGETAWRRDLACGTPQAQPGCRVTVRFLYQAIRALPPQAVFAQFLTGFQLARHDPRVVGLNLVAPEDGYTALHDFHLQMQMLDFLHRRYPTVKISLHAGELTPALVRPRNLRFHIRESVELGHASRIGHGVDIMHETRPFQLLREMRRRHVLVEICLTSNWSILGVAGRNHPLPLYLRYHVPVALATDDEGVSRSDMTRQFVRAERDFQLPYATLKRMVRDSLDHAFLAGASLWRAPETFQPVAACAAGPLGAARPAPACARFLAGSPKARLEWRLEGQFQRFEARYERQATSPRLRN